jgi:hypothetical protein
VVDLELDELFPYLPAISLQGPRGVGKTETAARRCGVAFRLDDPSVLAVVRADASVLLRGRRPVLVDEWQRLPEVWDVVRRNVDEVGRPGSWLLTGSARPIGAEVHSGAGRIVTVRMRPWSLWERGAQPSVSLRTLLQGPGCPIEGETTMGVMDYAHEIGQSGFPAFRGLSGRALRASLSSYLDRVVEVDLPEIGKEVRRPGALRRWMTAYAAATATTASFETIRAAGQAGEGSLLAKSTLIPYREALERLAILDPVPAWAPTYNEMRRLSSPPKHFLADPALALSLLGLDPDALCKGDPGPLPALSRGPLLGALFEALVVLSVRVYAQLAEAQVFHFRSHGGEREVDLIVRRPDGRIVAMEVKLAGAADDDDVRHLLHLKRELRDEVLDLVLVHSGRRAYRRPDGVAVIPAALLGP